MEKIRISGIINESIVDGPGIRLVVFTQGCKHNCKDCHNPHTHTFDGGYDMEIGNIVQLVESNGLLDGITLSGGDPFEQPLAASKLANKVKQLGLSVVTYTGYTIERLIEIGEHNQEVKSLLIATDILIDGCYQVDKRDLTLPFIGSSNQRIIDVKTSIAKGKIVLERSYANV